MSLFLLSAGTLWQREIVRFLRQRSRIVGALGQPILFWLLLGAGFGNSFRAPGITQRNAVRSLTVAAGGRLPVSSHE